MSNLSSSYSDTDEKVYLSQLTPTFGISANDRRNAQEHINMLWKMNQCILLYLSSGAGRGLELTRVHPFSHYQEYFNSLRFLLRSEKNVIHGIDMNDMTPHFISPTLSRFVVILNTVLYPAVEASPHFSLFSMEEAPVAAAEMFSIIMGLEKTVSTKICRDFIVQIMNFLSPQATGKYTTSKEFAEQFHHSWKTHQQSYSSTVFERNSNGEIRGFAITIARVFWRALGETEYNDSSVADRFLPTLSSEIYDLAAGKALRDSSLKCFNHQREACMIIDDRTRNDNVVVHVAPGHGKSGIWNYTLLARSITGSTKTRVIVICPYNPNLAQQELKSKSIFFGTNVKVYSITSSTLEQQVTAVSDFDLLYISMDAFQTLRTNETYSCYLVSWNVNIIFVDEFHCSFIENFRHEDSWQGLRNLSAIGSKVCLVTATTNATATKMIANYVGIGDSYVVVGGPSSYSLPKISFQVKQSPNHSLMQDVVTHIGSRLQPTHERANTAIHVLTVSRENAKELSKMINKIGIKAQWITSECNLQQRQLTIKLWDQGQLSVLVSTYCLGLDNAKVREVIVVGGCSSVCNAIQSAGRIRPNQQKGPKSKVYFWLGDQQQWLRNNTQVQQNMNYLNAAGYFDCFETEAEKMKAMTDMACLYEHTGLDGVIYKTRECIMVGLHKHLGVKTSDCGICSYCKDNSHSFQDRETATESEQLHQRNKMLVLQYITTIAQRCIVCNSSQCNGFECIPTKGQSSSQYCFRCFGYTGKGSNNFHRRDACACSSSNITTQGKSCPSCFMAIGTDIPNCGTMEMHNTGNCLHKDRIKRILLYDLVGSTDCGISAYNRLDPLLRNHRLWIDMMAKNIRKILASNSS